MTLREFQVFVVEVCQSCAWNHLIEQYLLGRDALQADELDRDEAVRFVRLGPPPRDRVVVTSLGGPSMNGLTSLTWTRPRPIRASSAASVTLDIRQGGCGAAAQIVSLWRRPASPSRASRAVTATGRCDRMNSYGDPQSARARARVPGRPLLPRQTTTCPAPLRRRRPSTARRVPAGRQRRVPRRRARRSAPRHGRHQRPRLGGGAPAGRAPVGSRPGRRSRRRRRGRPGAYGGRAAVARAAVRPGPGRRRGAATRRRAGGRAAARTVAKAGQAPPPGATS